MTTRIRRSAYGNGAWAARASVARGALHALGRSPREVPDWCSACGKRQPSACAGNLNGHEIARSAISTAVAFQTANSLGGEFEDAGLLTEITGGKRGRVFRYVPYLAFLRDDAPVRSGAGDLQTPELRNVGRPSGRASRTATR